MYDSPFPLEGLSSHQPAIQGWHIFSYLRGYDELHALRLLLSVLLQLPQSGRKFALLLFVA